MKADQRNDVWNVCEEKSVQQKLDSTLVEAAINGDVESFTELCRRYYPPMVAIAHSIIGDRHLAEDAAQQAFANAARKLPQLRSKNRFGSWLAAICRNAALDMASDTAKLRSTGELMMATTDSVESEACVAVKRAIERLSTSEKEAIFLRYYDGMSYEKISAVLGISEQAINGRLRRAKKKVADYMRKNGYGKGRL